MTEDEPAGNIGQVMERIVEQGLLYDFYGPLLTKHQQDIYEKVVYDNLSLNEIAEAEGISKQAVHDLVRRCTAMMRSYEEKLGMIRRFSRIAQTADRIMKIAQDGDLPAESAAQLRGFAQRIRDDLAT